MDVDGVLEEKNDDAKYRRDYRDRECRIDRDGKGLPEIDLASHGENESEKDKRVKRIFQQISAEVRDSLAGLWNGLLVFFYCCLASRLDLAARLVIHQWH